MGIPSFYKWIESRYPGCVKPVREDAPVTVKGVKLPVDTTGPNPNGIEFDNLYIDMNGIIHPCFHPEAVPALTTYEEIFEGIFKYIDRMFSLIRPRKLLFLAIDGVAPRAKMNQQRSRRFRNAKDAADAALGAERLKRAFESGGVKSSPLEQSKKLDPNVITPGTEFMDLLSSALRYYIHLRMNEDLGWKRIKVILSDASVPGEGEHKIMSYIRLQRNLPGYDPNTRHCLYGLDADLIMLALATHEIHFAILREDLKLGLDKVPKYKRKPMMYKKLREKRKMRKSGNLEDYITRLKFKLLHIWTLREYLERDMRIEGLTVEADLERLIDDFVFMCLFVGNDFLPRIPSLDISKGAIRLLLSIYTREFVRMGGYLTDSFEVNLERVQHFVQAVGNHEHEILSKSGMTGKETQICTQGFSNNKPLSDPPNLPLIERNTESTLDCTTAPVCQHLQTYSGTENGNTSDNCKFVGTNAIIDEVRIREKSWKARYYAEKFEVETEVDCERIRRDAVFKYVEGICWVMRYYYEGVCSWQWFYPYHYAPLASDFYAIDKLDIHFSIGEPFKPLDQLMGVLPAASAHALPLFYRKLMTESSSPILDFYPADFEVDTDGKRFCFQAICKLPFIEESRLLSETSKVEHTLTDEERRRNNWGLDVLFVHISHPLGVEINSFCKQMNVDTKFLEAEVKQKMDPKFSGGMNGYVCISDKSVWPEEIHSPVEGMKMIAKNEVLSVFYKNPPFHSHIPRPLPGIILPKKSLGQKEKGKLFSKSVNRKLHGSERRFSKRPIHAKRLEETKTEVKSRIRNPKFKERKHNEIVGVSNNAVEKMNSSTLTEQNEVDGDRASADGLQRTIPEVNSRKKNRRSKKRKVSEGGDSARKSVEKVDSTSPKDPSTADVNKASTDGLLGAKTEVNTKGFQGTNTELKVSGLQGIETEVKTKKKKRRPKKRKLNVSGDPHMIVERLESSFRKVSEGGNSAHKNVEKVDTTSPREQSTADVSKASTNGLQGAKTEVNTNEFQGTNTEVKVSGLQGIETEAKTKKKKRRPKKRKLNESGGPHMIVEKLESSSMKVSEGGDNAHKNVEKVDNTSPREQNTGDVSKASTDGLQGAKTEVNTNGFQGANTEVKVGGLQGIETKVKTKKKNRRPKKRKLNESGDPHMIVEKLESSFTGEQHKGDGNQASVYELQGAKREINTDGCQGIRPEVNTNGVQQVIRAKVNANGLQGIQTEVNADGLQGIRTEVNANGMQGIKTEVKSGKKKRRPKKKKQSEHGNAVHKGVEKLESSGEQNKGEVNHAVADGLNGKLTEVNANRFQDMKTEANAYGLQGSPEVNVSGLQGLTTEVKSRKKKRRPKKLKLSEGSDISHKDVEKPESSSPGELNKGDGSQATSDVLQLTKTEVNTNRLQEIVTEVSKSGLQGTITEVNTNLLQQIETEVKSRKKKRRSKNQKLHEGGDNLLKSVEKSESSFHGEQNEGNGNQVGAGKQGTKAEVHAYGLQGINTEVNSRKRKQRPKKRNPSEGGNILHESVDKPENSFSREQSGGYGNQTSADVLQGTNTGANRNGLQGLITEANTIGLQGTIAETNTNRLEGTIAETNTNRLEGTIAEANTNMLQGTITVANTDGLQRAETEVKSRKRKWRSKNQSLQAGGDVSLKSAEKSETRFHNEKNRGDGNQAGTGVQEAKAEINAIGLLGTKTDMNINGLQSTNPEVKSRKRKSRPRKRKQNKSDSAPMNIDEKLESQFPRQKGDGNGEHADADKLKAVKNEVNQSKSDCAPKAVFTETEIRVLQGEGHDHHAGSDGMQQRKQDLTAGKGNENVGKEQMQK